MSRAALTQSRRLRRRDELGTVAIIVSLCMTFLCVVAAMVLDFGLVKVDRQVDKSAADAAVMAGIRAMDFSASNTAKSYVGVCAALQFLKANQVRFSGLSESTGWSDGNGNPTGNGCDPALPYAGISCSSSNRTTWARYQATQSVGGLTYTVNIQSGYDFSDSANWKEDSLPATSADHATDPCMDLELTINQSRKPGLGSLATSGQLQTGIRTVGRAQVGPGGYAPAMLLLKRTGCAPNPLQIGGSNSFIHVLGFSSAAGDSQPGTIHSDDDGGGCTASGNKVIFNGANVADSIVAYGAPLAASPSSPDPSRPGQITTVYASNGGADITRVRDAFADVYGASGISPAASGTHSEATGRALVTRQPVDFRYLSAVRGIVADSLANYFSQNFTSKAAANTANWGYASCTNGAIGPTQIDNYDPLVHAAWNGLYVDCPDVTSVPSQTIAGWRTIVFKGTITMTGGGNSLLLPDATRVYVGGTSANPAKAITIGGSGASFQMHTLNRTVSDPSIPATFPDSFLCNSAPTTDRGLLVVKSGSLNDGNFFRACNTTVVMLGGDTTGGCLPTYDPLTQAIGPDSTHSPCPSSSVGTGQLNINGLVDWTAPNQCVRIDNTTCDGNPLAAGGGWQNTAGPEDLALWSESAAYGPTNAVIGGSSNFNLHGVFMTPNFDPMTLGGGPNTTLTNAQFVASSLTLNGGAKLTMTVDPNSAVKLKRLLAVGLVR